MILLKPDHLVFKTSNGEMIPCSVKSVVIEMIGDSADYLDPVLIKHAAEAVLHYFKEELHREEVSMGEFSLALEQVLKGFGLDVKRPESETPLRVIETDFAQLLTEQDKAWELAFFPRLREALGTHLAKVPDVICFKGLRPCVKQLVGARRWCPRCETMSDQIVEFLRGCLHSSGQTSPCSLIVT